MTRDWCLSYSAAKLDITFEKPTLSLKKNLIQSCSYLKDYAYLCSKEMNYENRRA